MSSLSTGDYRRLLEFVGEALRGRGPEFPSTELTGSLREMFRAEVASAGDVDLRGRASRTWADSPAQVAMAEHFHEAAIDHPLTRAYRSTGLLVPLRLSDFESTRQSRLTHEELGMSRLLTIPLSLTSRRLCAVALMRSRHDFLPRDIELAQQLQPVLGGIYALRNHDPSEPPHVSLDPDLEIHLTVRELCVLDKLASGLIAAAIARQLGISPRTVGKHIESIYRKLDTHDRTSAVLRAQQYGLLSAPLPGHSSRIGR